jgi:hypothetical protein
MKSDLKKRRPQRVELLRSSLVSTHTTIKGRRKHGHLNLKEAFTPRVGITYELLTNFIRSTFDPPPASLGGMTQR